MQYFIVHKYIRRVQSQFDFMSAQYLYIIITHYNYNYFSLYYYRLVELFIYCKNVNQKNILLRISMQNIIKTYRFRSFEYQKIIIEVFLICTFITIRSILQQIVMNGSFNTFLNTNIFYMYKIKLIFILLIDVQTKKDTYSKIFYHVQVLRILCDFYIIKRVKYNIDIKYIYIKIIQMDQNKNQIIENENQQKPLKLEIQQLKNQSSEVSFRNRQDRQHLHLHKSQQNIVLTSQKCNSQEWIVFLVLTAILYAILYCTEIYQKSLK